MKKFFSFVVVTLMFCASVSAQAPQLIPFQAIVRDTNNNILPNQGMAIRVDILSGSPTGTLLYQEVQSATSNSLGLLNLSIGAGAVQSGSMSGISWGSGPIYVEIEVDMNGGSNFTVLGVTQLQSVPYALYALNGGGSAATQPSSQITYGTGNGLTSDNGFTRDTASQKTIISDSKGSQGVTQIRVDSAKLFMNYYDYATGNSAGSFVGPMYSDWGLNSVCVANIVYDQNNQILYGFYAVADSSQMQTGGTEGGAIVGTKLYSAYLDVAMVENPNSPFNSLTVDTNGMHWEYNDTDRYTFPNADGAPGQVLSTNGGGILSWVNSGVGSSAPSGQITYGTGSGVTSDYGFTRDFNTQKTIISDNKGSQSSTQFYLDSNDVYSRYYSPVTQTYAGAYIGASDPDRGFTSTCVENIAYDINNQIEWGFFAVADSAQILTGGTDGGAIVGTKLYSAYLDVAMVENPNSPFNSLTVDTNGLHWQYNDTDRYVFPNADGTAGQVMTTNGSGVLSFTSLPVSTPNAWNAHQILTGTGSTSDTITVQNIKNNIYSPGISISSLVINLPGSPNDGDIFILTFKSSVGSISYQNGSVAPGSLASALSAQQITFTYDATNAAWY